MTREDLLERTHTKLRHNQSVADHATDSPLKAYYQLQADYYTAVKAIVEKADESLFLEG